MAPEDDGSVKQGFAFYSNVATMEKLLSFVACSDAGPLGHRLFPVSVLVSDGLRGRGRLASGLEFGSPVQVLPSR